MSQHEITDHRLPAGEPDTESRARQRRRSVLGTAALFAGVAILALRLLEGAGDLPWRLPRSWYIDRTLWVAAGLASFAAGWLLLREEERGEDRSAFPRSQPGKAGRHRVVLYTRAGCHLCDEARDTLAAQQGRIASLTEVDIDGDPSLVERFSTCVPVVEIDGKVRFRGRVNRILLRRLFEAESFAGAEAASAPRIDTRAGGV
jgi:hypothetical protein